MTGPTFSVIVATWNRGKHILPTLRSVLNQRCKDFELLVVGDGCTDDTEQVVRGLASSKIRWLSLPQRRGSQAFANNAGLQAARGRYIAYLGHDDIWAADHLSTLASTFTSQPVADFAVSGLLLHGPPGSSVVIASGLFAPSEDIKELFFPPSSIAHRRDVAERIGYWRPPFDIPLPVDSDFQVRAIAAGMSFCSTGRVTAHKFTSTKRYLSYICQTSDEQEFMLERLQASDAGTFVEGLLERAREIGTVLRHPAHQDFKPGELAQYNNRVRGLGATTVTHLTKPFQIEQTDDPRGLDWHGVEFFGSPPSKFRWSGPNPRSKILIPFRTYASVEIELHVISAVPGYFDDLTISVNGETIEWTLLDQDEVPKRVSFRSRLNGSPWTVIELRGPVAIPANLWGSDDRRQIGVAISDVLVRPIVPLETLGGVITKLCSLARGLVSRALRN